MFSYVSRTSYSLRTVYMLPETKSSTIAKIIKLTSLVHLLLDYSHCIIVYLLLFVVMTSLYYAWNTIDISQGRVYFNNKE